MQVICTRDSTKLLKASLCLVCDRYESTFKPRTSSSFLKHLYFGRHFWFDLTFSFFIFIIFTRFCSERCVFLYTHVFTRNLESDKRLRKLKKTLYCDVISLFSDFHEIFLFFLCLHFDEISWITDRLKVRNCSNFQWFG